MRYDPPPITPSKQISISKNYKIFIKHFSGPKKRFFQKNIYSLIFQRIFPFFFPNEGMKMRRKILLSSRNFPFLHSINEISIFIYLTNLKAIKYNSVSLCLFLLLNDCIPVMSGFPICKQILKISIF